MARHPFARTPAEYAIGEDGVPLPGRDGQGNVLVSGTVWTAATGGSQLTDLQNPDGSPISGGIIVPEQNGRVPAFLGPDNVNSLWIDFGLGRHLLNTTDIPARVAVLEAGGVQPAGMQYPATCVVYSSEFRTTRPVTDASQNTWTCDGVSDQVEIQAAIDAAASDGGKVLLLGGLFNITGIIRIRTGVALVGDAQGTVIRAASDFATGMVGLFDNTAHSTTLACLTLDGAFRNVSNIHYVANGGEVFTSRPASNPDPNHRILDVDLLSAGNSSNAGYGMRMQGGNLRAGKYERIRILNASGTGIWADGCVDSVWQSFDIGSCGDSALGYSTSTTGPLGMGVFINQGDNNHWTDVKSWFSKGPGFTIRGTRNTLTACEAQDNDGYGFDQLFGKNIYQGCLADSNGQSLGVGAGGGRAGFRCATESNVMVGCQAMDRRGWQQHGFEFTTGFRQSVLIGGTYSNVAGSTIGTAGAGNFVQVVPDLNGR